jgi:hypothetical protein
MQFKSKGKIRYSPDTRKNDNKWWVILDCQVDIGKYYRNLYELSTFKTQKLRVPSWKEHITIVRNEKPLNEDAWRLYNNKKVEFEYSTIPRWNDQYYWLDVRCDFFYQLRVELGLMKEPEIPFHLTFGTKL